MGGDINEFCPEKVITADEAISKIKKGSRVFISSGCGEPQYLIRTLVDDMQLQDVMLYQMLSFTLSDYMGDPSFHERFSLKGFFSSSRMRKAAFEGKIDYVPVYISEIPDLFENNQIGLEVALIQVSPPDIFGFCSLGISVDVCKSAIKNAKMVIAQVNPRMPRTWGETFVHLNEINFLVHHEEPLVESVLSFPDEVAGRRIASYVAELIEDGATLQVGLGRLPYYILSCIEEKNDLGIHTQMISDVFIPLFEKGIITNKKKNFFPERAVATICMGTEKIYNYVNNNPMFYFRSADLVNDPAIVARNDHLISISSASEVDLTGQVCADSLGRFFSTGMGDQANFIRGAAMSKGGFSIIALPSTAKNGTVSRIVPNLSENAGIATLREDVNFVVTEYGVAQLRGKSIYQRVIELAQIAHPKFRERLIDEARSCHYIFSDQLPPPSEDLFFLENYKSKISLKNGTNIFVRPILPSDESSYRNFFYSLSEETIFLRFFRKISVFSHEMVQQHWASLDYRKNMSLIGQVQVKNNREIIAIGTYAEDENDRAEVAFVVRDDFQDLGVGTYLLEQLEKIAKENQYKGFTATVLPENKSVIHIFKKRYAHLKMKRKKEGIRIRMDFNL